MKFLRLVWILPWLLGIEAFHNIEYSHEMIEKLGQSCFFDKDSNTKGWRCDNAANNCLPLNRICDGVQDCLPDKSDEELGCRIFEAETECYSWYGRKHFKCPNNNRCVEDIQDCYNQTLPLFRCTSNQGSEGLRCLDGQCLNKKHICNGEKDCFDGSDEKEGCSLFPETGCFSWHGQKHVKCEQKDSSRVICNLPKTNEEDCRRCKDSDYWRCNNGRCIAHSKKGDGIRDCEDGSDERPVLVPAWILFIVITFTLLMVVIVSFGMRCFANKKSYMKCSKCIDTPEESLTDIPMDLINCLENPANWRKKDFGLNKDNLEGAKRQYWKVHNDPQQLQSLYQYLIHRNKYPHHLSRILTQLKGFEQEFHKDYQRGHPEVLKCWRLHLGSTDILKAVINAVKTASKQNEQQDHERNTDETKFFKVLSYGLLPFLDVVAMYLEMAKNIAIACLVYNSLYDMTMGEVWSPDNKFETTVAITIIFAICLVQFLFSLMSLKTGHQIFELCDHVKQAHPWRSCAHKVFCFAFGSLMPVFLVGNYQFLKKQEVMLKKAFQKYGEIDEEEQQHLNPENPDSSKEILFKQIQSVRIRSALNRRVYYHFRIVHASIESFIVTTCFIVLCVLSPMDGRSFNLLRGLSPMISDFFLIHTSHDPMSAPYEFVNSLSFWIIALCSLASITTGLVGYLYHCKNSNMTRMGIFSFGLYSMANVINRSTLSIAKLSVIELYELNWSPESQVFLSLTTLMFCALLELLLIYVFKHKTIQGFGKSKLEDQLVHIFFNTLLVIPFKSMDEFNSGQALLQKEKSQICPNNDAICPTMSARNRTRSCNIYSRLKDEHSPKEQANQTKGHRPNPYIEQDLTKSVNSTSGGTSPTGFVPGHRKTRSEGRVLEVGSDEKPSLKRMQSMINIPSNSLIELEYQVKMLLKNGAITQLDTDIVIATLKSIDKGYLITSDLDVEKIIGLVKREQDIEALKVNIQVLWWNNPVQALTLDDIKERIIEDDESMTLSDQDIEDAFNTLKSENLINKKLFHPRSTKAEYFWLLLIMGLGNIILLIIEISYNGWISNYHYSCIALSSYFLGLFFLALYYKHFHTMKILTAFVAKDLGRIFRFLAPGEPMKARPDIELSTMFSDTKEEKPNTSINIAIQTDHCQNENNEFTLSKYMNTSTPSTTQDCQQDVPEIAIMEKIRSKSSEELATAFLNHGSKYYRSGKFEEAIQHYQMCLETFNQNRKHQHYKTSIFEAHSNLGFCYLGQKNYEEALTQYKVALKIKDKMKDDEFSHSLLSKVVKGMAQCHEMQNEHQEALKHYKTALEIDKRNHGKDTQNEEIASGMFNLATINNKLGNYDQALNYVNEALEIRKQYEQKVCETVCLRMSIQNNQRKIAGRSSAIEE